ncbi:hypothetical protein BDM02DRAFT_1746311 [Thelephora ganbajun]|uniref:Uncharacterized protein n=1 Tax=Thelephora ganbajun TaxID=370292 RepID=A0ACB6ZK17_THEGA|nr:hypothetical protein BDM02DRAFT_1746311 [Thelephora ganbajun]
MTQSPTNGSSSIFKDGKLKPGIYKIQNLHGQTYMDVHEHSRDVCCRPATALEEGRGLWEIKPLGAGYFVQRVEPEKPDQFCVPLRGLGDGARPSLGVTPYPMAWRLALAEDEEHPYVSLYWETTNTVWDLDGGSNVDGTKVSFFPDIHRLQLNGIALQVLICEDKSPRYPRRIWKLIPVKVEDTLAPSQLLSEMLGSGSLPPYNGNPTGQSSTHAQRTEAEHDEFGTVVNEVTVVTTTSTVTTHKKYRVEDA